MEEEKTNSASNFDSILDNFFKSGDSASESEFDDVLKELKHYNEDWEKLSDTKYHCLIINIIAYFEKFEKYGKGISFIEEIYEEFKNKFNLDNQKMSKLNEVWAKFYISENIESQALKRLEVAAFYQFIDKFVYSGFDFFCFRAFTPYAWDDLIHSKITLVHPRKFNDPMDTPLLKWNQNLYEEESDEIQRRLRLLYQRVYDHIKVKCFVKVKSLPRGEQIATGDRVRDIIDISPLMWSHYADFHKGFCLKYKLDSDVLSIRDYNNLIFSRIADVIYKEKMGNNEMKNLTVFDSLFNKYKGWEYEEEVRIVHYDPNCQSDFKEISISPDSVKEIYLGLRCSDENRDKMKCFLRDKAIKLYQMRIDPNDCYKLIKERIL